jgi:hypothetical protein
MGTKDIHTLEELMEVAAEQDLRIEEKGGKYRVVKILSEKFGLVGVKAGDGYSLDNREVHKFLTRNSFDIGARITDWSKTHEPKLHQ